MTNSKPIYVLYMYCKSLETASIRELLLKHV